MTRTTTFAPLFEPLAVGARRSGAGVDGDWPRKVAAGALDDLRTCPCDPPTCIRTQLSGVICEHWPADTKKRGHLGFQASGGPA